MPARSLHLRRDSRGLATFIHLIGGTPVTLSVRERDYELAPPGKMQTAPRAAPRVDEPF